ncbi:2-dehydro-3-deoxygalactonokinase [Brevirhabdus pacifica]|nr:2-dehydro-3-deoxygalactonokinase [Brevirhabdus pacifica]PJJ85946.1 2-dehydro-3-deoxygalactonokinase [Brevirhabdus pacifica]
MTAGAMNGAAGGNGATPWLGALIEDGRIEMHGFDPAGRALTCLSAQAGESPADQLAAMAAQLDPRAEVLLLAGWTGGTALPARPVPCTPLAEGEATAVAPRGYAGPRLVALPPIGQASPPDLMGAAAIRVAGALVMEPEFDGVICVVGARSFWVHVSAGEIVSFQGFLAGALLDRLAPPDPLANKDHALLTTEGAAQAFDTALAETRSRPERLAAALHRATLKGTIPPQDDQPDSRRATIAGALIGAELTAARPYWLGQRVLLLADAPLAEVYKRALDAQGAEAGSMSAQQAAALGLAAARASL